MDVDIQAQALNQFGPRGVASLAGFVAYAVLVATTINLQAD